MFPVYSGFYAASVDGGADLIPLFNSENLPKFKLISFHAVGVVDKIIVGEHSVVGRTGTDAVEGLDVYELNNGATFALADIDRFIIDSEYSSDDFRINYLYTFDSTAPRVDTPVPDKQGALPFPATVSLSIPGDTLGAKIYYTTDGSTPTAESTEYTAPITINTATTLKTIGIYPDAFQSAVGEFSYTQAKAATPVATPAAGEVESGTEITLTTTTATATIYYTDDGTTPDEDSTEYTAPIELTADTTIKAIAIADGYSDSDVLTAAYTIATP